MIELRTNYDTLKRKYFLESDTLDETTNVPIWMVEIDMNTDLPFHVSKYDASSYYEPYGEYRTLDRVMQVINGNETSTMVSQLLPLVDGKTVLLKFGQDISFNYTSHFDEKVSEIHFTNPNEVTFIMEKQTIPENE